MNDQILLFNWNICAKNCFISSRLILQGDIVGGINACFERLTGVPVHQILFFPRTGHLRVDCFDVSFYTTLDARDPDPAVVRQMPKPLQIPILHDHHTLQQYADARYLWYKTGCRFHSAVKSDIIRSCSVLNEAIYFWSPTLTAEPYKEPDSGIWRVRYIIDDSGYKYYMLS